MLNVFWKKLKSGSDIRGSAVSTFEGENIELSNEIVEKISYAFSSWLSKKFNLAYTNISVAIGHDSRLSALRIKNVVINSLRSIGITVYDCSLATTPAMFMAVSALQCTASISITASHLSYEKNGFKFFVPEGGLSSQHIEEILELAQKDEPIISSKTGSVRSVNLMNHYSTKLKNMIENNLGNKLPLKGLKIVVDAGNGAGGFFASEVLKPLGADVSCSTCLAPDGNFPVHAPNPEDKKALNYVANATKNANADIGIIFDTDVDRVSIIDSEGHQIAGTRLIALVASIVIRSSEQNIIVTDSMTHESLRAFIAKLGGYQFRYKRGYNNVISMAKKINEKGGNCPLAIETSGHAAFKENNFMDDGAYLACKIIIELMNLRSNNRTLQDCTKDLVVPNGEFDTRISLLESEDALKIMQDLKRHVDSNKNVVLDKENFEGIRIHFPAKHQNGWVIIRESLHDAKLVVHAESYVLGGIKSIGTFIKGFLKKYKFKDDISSGSFSSF